MSADSKAGRVAPGQIQAEHLVVIFDFDDTVLQTTPLERDRHLHGTSEYNAKYASVKHCTIPGSIPLFELLSRAGVIPLIATGSMNAANVINFCSAVPNTVRGHYGLYTTVDEIYEKSLKDSTGVVFGNFSQGKFTQTQLRLVYNRINKIPIDQSEEGQVPKAFEDVHRELNMLYGKRLSLNMASGLFIPIKSQNRNFNIQKTRIVMVGNALDDISFAELLYRDGVLLDNETSEKPLSVSCLYLNAYPAGIYTPEFIKNNELYHAAAQERAKTTGFQLKKVSNYTEILNELDKQFGLKARLQPGEYEHYAAQIAKEIAERPITLLRPQKENKAPAEPAKPTPAAPATKPQPRPLVRSKSSPLLRADSGNPWTDLATAAPKHFGIGPS